MENVVVPSACRADDTRATFESQGRSASLSMTVLTRTCDGATPVIVSTAALPAPLSCSRPPRRRPRREPQPAGR